MLKQKIKELNEEAIRLLNDNKSLNSEKLLRLSEEVDELLIKSKKK